DDAAHQPEHEPDHRADHHRQPAQDARDGRAGVVALGDPPPAPGRAALLLAGAPGARPVLVLLVVVAVEPGPRLCRDPARGGRADAGAALLDRLDLGDLLLVERLAGDDVVLLGRRLSGGGDNQDARAGGAAGLAAGPLVLGAHGLATCAGHRDRHGEL